jgi:hypothetical protein
MRSSEMLDMGCARMARRVDPAALVNVRRERRAVNVDVHGVHDS